MDLTPVHTFNLTGDRSVSKRIISANYRQLITLTLFFLPLSIFAIIIPTFDSSNHQKFLTYCIIYTFIIYIFTLCATGSIIYLTHHAFFGSPVNLSDALKSLTTSFFRLALTTIIAQGLTVLISATYLVSVGTILMLVQKLWFVIDYNLIYFFFFSLIARVILLAIILYVNVEWSLALVVVVVESKWGFSALTRSAYLIKGMRSVSLYFGVGCVGMVWMCYESRHVLFITILSSFFAMLFLPRLITSNTVLYNYCKALHGELVIAVGERFDHEYMSLPEDDDKIPHVVTVVAA